ncbi:sensor domain-containing diguanylate cyclase [Aestuariibacter salexigens]|uniref:sensor domain-containing diguanylate cyclase n=1 Tax=Aestuariibacter salexigens TaxID=226010 RepID=UPI00041DD4E5|nr:sensor domain-containing diguanylate cyclase [Aestuariibacter salexigens]
MNLFKTLHRSILSLFIIVVVSIVTLVHFSMSKIVAEQSREQQQSLSPAFSLIVEQLFEPLHIAQTLAKSRELIELMSEPEPDETQMFTMLSRLNQEFDMKFFIASDVARRQYNSDGTTHELVRGEISWYFTFRDVDTDAFADIGKWENTHFYIDLKIYDDAGRFVGFFGVGKSLESFLQIFDDYKKQFGYDFFFVNPDGDIMLTSEPELVASQAQFRNMQDLSWYQALSDEQKQQSSLNNLLVNYSGSEYLIAEMNIDPFNWTLYLLTPLEHRQAQISRAFIFSVVVLLVVIFALFLLIYNLLYYFKQRVRDEQEFNPLTLLANRNAMQIRYNELMQEHNSISVMLVDIDHLASVNQTYDEATGDEVLRKVAGYLQEKLPIQAYMGRWNSEEFVILLPDIGPHDAYEMAQRLRTGIASMQASSTHPALRITCSFGVSFTSTSRTMQDLVARADEAVYRAKRDGCNLVRTQLLDSP